MSILLVSVFLISSVSAAAKASATVSIYAGLIDNDSKIDSNLKDELKTVANSRFAFDIDEEKRPTVKAVILTTDNDKLLQDKDIEPDIKLDNINVIAGEFTVSEIVELSADDDSIYLSQDEEVEIDLDDSIDMIRAKPYNIIQNSLGSGSKVCIIDTGIDDSHPYLKKLSSNNVVSFVPGVDYKDGHGHGTHVAGIVMAEYTSTRTLIDKAKIQGVAPAVDLYVVKVLDDTGHGYMSWVLQGIDWCVNQKDVDVVSMSLHSGHFNDINVCQYTSECRLINQLSETHDTIFVAASGNTGKNELGSPACCTNSISVGNARKDGTISSSSSWHETLDFVAPGTSILSAFPGRDTTAMSGTSMATPHVAGAFALLKSLKPSASNEDLYNALDESAIDLGADIAHQGNGLINLYGACNVLFDIKETDRCANVIYDGLEIREYSNKIDLRINSRAWIKVKTETTNSDIEEIFYRYKTMSNSNGFAVDESAELIGNLSSFPIYLKEVSNGYEIYIYDFNRVADKTRAFKEATKYCTERYAYRCEESYRSYNPARCQCELKSEEDLDTLYTRMYIFKQLDKQTSRNVVSYKNVVSDAISSGEFEAIGISADNAPSNICAASFSNKYQVSSCILHIN